MLLVTICTLDVDCDCCQCHHPSSISTLGFFLSNRDATPANREIIDMWSLDAIQSSPAGRPSNERRTGDRWNAGWVDEWPQGRVLFSESHHHQQKFRTCERRNSLIVGMHLACINLNNLWFIPIVDTQHFLKAKSKSNDRRFSGARFHVETH